MADFEVKENPSFSDTMRKLEITDEAHADLFNKPFKTLLDNDNYLKKNVSAVKKELSSGTEAKVSEHNASEAAHADIRNLIATLANKLNTLADSDDTTLDQLSEIIAYIKSNRSLIENVTTGKANKAGDEFTGDVIFDNYLGIKAWPGYGNDVAKMWYNGNTKTLDFEGDVKNIDLNATSATNADTVDEKHASDFISKEGKDNIVKERFTVLSGTTVSGSGTGDTSKTGYLRVATLTIRSTYIDNPIVFEIAARGWNYTTTLYIKFKSTGNNDPDLASFLIDRKTQDKVYLHKRNPSIWDLYVYKSTGHGYSTTYSLRSSLLGRTQGAVGIEHPKDVLIETLPSGSIEPNVIIAEKVKDSDTVDGKHASDFVNKAGDTMTGDLVVPIGRANVNMSVPCAGRIDSTTLIPQGLSEYKTFLGSIVDENSTFWNIISTRHGNGYNDGRYFGMYIRSLLLDEGSHGGSLLWNKQMGSNKGWLGERVLLDSVNYKDFCLPLSGGTMTGDLVIPVGRAGENLSAPCCGRLDGEISDIADFSNYKTFLGSYNDGSHFNFIISIRHGNGSADGYKYGLYLKSVFGKDTNLVWGQQNTEWTNEKTLLDSSNYEKYCLPLSNEYLIAENSICRLSLLSKIGNTDRCGIEAYTKGNGRTGGLYFYNGNATLKSYNIFSIDVTKDVDVARAYYFDTEGLYPILDHVDLGKSSFHWRNIYANNGTIQTSDRTKKTNINSLETQKAKAFIHGLNPVSYKMIDGTSGRTHYGFIAQDIEELINTLNMDSKDFAGFIKSPKKVIKYEDENGTKLENPIEEVIENEYDYALRYDEFIAPLIKVVQEQQKTIEQQQRIIEQQQIAIKNQQKEIEQIKKELSKMDSSM